ncbi:MAG: TraR/DksA family transcriptional regulator [Candidatus Binatus sp.]|uniref:TraR/DksA family transcriptional regulator n=1 Tax=Candidatus Binatus sp. TaxID=2811406 RepID=UPI00271D575F|nr:TraR/DksA family transcriptional regulator [Candidatus Binatus sp.]MDO8432751.1 TraR/DksA family transcriptional regulator [Candidatus Binatus sp.]
MRQSATSDSRRTAALGRLLEKQREDTLARVRDFRRGQADDVASSPGDEMDVARSLADVETHAALIERAQERLKAIDAAIARLSAGAYGKCMNCGEEVPLERLQAVPFAQYCIDCQDEMNDDRRTGQGTISRAMRRRWTVPEELAEPSDDADTEEHPESAAHVVEDDLNVSIDSAFGPDEDEPQVIDVEKRRRGRPPKAKQRA